MGATGHIKKSTADKKLSGRELKGRHGGKGTSPKSRGRTTSCGRARGNWQVERNGAPAR